MFAVSGVDGTETKKFWTNNKADGEWLMEVLDEATNTVVKLFCQNKACKGFGGYITRTAADSRKMMYACDDCGKPMTRKVKGEAGEVTSEKQHQTVQEQTNPGAPPRAPVVPSQPPKKGFASLEQLANWGGKGHPIPMVQAAVPEAPASQVLEAPLSRAGAKVLEDRVIQVEERQRLLEERVAKMEAESVAQAEAFQAMTEVVEGLLAAGAKTAKD
jgi:predicted  nucleic acid-binding Zn-ribbon protein